MKRWCGAAGVDKVKMLSDHRESSFGQAWGTLVKGLRLDARAVFVVDANDTVQYAEYVKEIAEHPNYDAVLEAAKRAAG
jgi:thiol peroxidase